jgi:hypothetical protein
MSVQPPVLPTPPNDPQQEINRLSAENLVLRQQMEFQRLFIDEREKQAQTFKEHKEKVDSEINKRLVGMTILGLIIAAIGWWSSIQPVRKLVADRLNKEFASDKIKKTISDSAQKAAASQTKDLMENILNPATRSALTQIQQQKDAVAASAAGLKVDVNQKIGVFQTTLDAQSKSENAALNQLREEYTTELDKLKDLVAYQEKLKEIQFWKGKAVDGDFESFQKLVMYASNDAALNDNAHEMALETKVVYLNTDRTVGTDIWTTNPDGSKKDINEKISTAELIYLFLNNRSQDWRFRVRAAKLLGSRRERMTPGALVQCMNYDPNLWVRRAALDSFQLLTRFAPNDVFAFQDASDWWTKNSDAYLNGLPKQ